MVLLDTRPSAHDEDSFEAAVEATASVVARLVRSGLPVEVLTTDGRTLGATGSGRRHGIGVEALLMDELAVVQPGGSDSLAGIARSLRAAQRRGMLVAVMGSLGGPVFDQVSALGAPSAPLVLVATRPGGDFAARATASLVTVDGTAGRFAIAWDAAMVTRSRTGTRARR